MKTIKKKGFTLAEVLITLGIIGVVAALTAPALIQNAGNAKIGPTLQKVKSTIENANERILYENDASKLSAVAGNNVVAYMELLSEHISGSSYETNTVTHKDFDPVLTEYSSNTEYAGYTYYPFKFSNSITILFRSTDEFSAKGSFLGDYMAIQVDINGMATSPNKLGKDVFGFHIDNSGAVVPNLSALFKWLSGEDDHIWDTTGRSDDQCNESYVKHGRGCAGSIFDNNLKVIYQ